MLLRGGHKKGVQFLVKVLKRGMYLLYLLRNDMIV